MLVLKSETNLINRRDSKTKIRIYENKNKTRKKSKLSFK